MTTDHSFQCDVETLADKDKFGNQVTMVRCRGRLVSDTAGEVKDVVRPLIASGGRIVIDLADVNHMDSSGLGALVGLKASAIKQGLCVLEFANMTPRVLELLRLTNLTQMFTT
jgi:anti-sigma B factor antagonist